MPLLSSIGGNAGQLNALTEQGRKALFLATRQGSAQGNAMIFIVGAELYDHLENVVDCFEKRTSARRSVGCTLGR
jgi:uncharacterized protein